MSIEAMKQALEALDGLSEPYDVLKAQAALRQAIEQAEKQEPVAYVDSKTIEWFLKPERGDEAFSVPTLTKKPFDYCDIPLYTAPPKREWVGLNWDDIPDVFVGDIAFMQGAKWALAKLKEKNL
jgi:hypothetical protein